MDCKGELAALGKKTLKNLQNVHKFLSRPTIPDGSLQVCIDGKHIKVFQIYYVEGKRTRKGIGRNKDLVRRLLHKEYLTEYEKRLQHNVDILKIAYKSMLPLDDESIYAALPRHIERLPQEYFDSWIPARMHPIFDNSIAILDIDLYIPEKDRAGWATRPYRANSLYLEQKRFKSIDGIKVRSKSELSLLEIYKNLGYPTHYDELYRFRDVVKSFDFVSMRDDGKLIFHEHCGRVNDPNYMRAHKEKLALYEEYGIVPWVNLIVTYDDANGGIDLALAEAMIKAMHN